MKKVLSIAAIAITVLSLASCKNSNNQAEETSEVEIIIPAEVASQLDSLAKLYSDLCAQVPAFEIEVSENEVEPDCLLDPSVSNILITKQQKINALAILECEYYVRKSYGMPLDESKEAIAKLAAEVNYAFSLDDILNKSLYDQYTEGYQYTIEKNEYDFYWQYALASEIEILYLLSTKPDFIKDNLDEDMFKTFLAAFKPFVEALIIMKDYNPQITTVMDMCKEASFIYADWDQLTIDQYVEILSDNAPLYESIRAELLQ